jgi:hypothetical protein
MIFLNLLLKGSPFKTILIFIQNIFINIQNYFHFYVMHGSKYVYEFGSLFTYTIKGYSRVFL